MGEWGAIALALLPQLQYGQGEKPDESDIITYTSSDVGGGELQDWNLARPREGSSQLLWGKSKAMLGD